MNSLFKIRNVIPVDLEKITSLFRDTITEINRRDYNEEQIKVWAGGADKKDRWLKRISEQFFICAEAENSIIGFGSITKEGYLDLLYVHKDYQGKGVASSLLSEMIHFAKTNGVSEIVSDVSLTARNFFELNGFSILKEQKVVIENVELVNYQMKKIIAG